MALVLFFAYSNMKLVVSGLDTNVKIPNGAPFLENCDQYSLPLDLLKKCVLNEFKSKSLKQALSILTIISFLGYLMSYYIFKSLKKNIENQRKFIANASHELRTPLTVMISDVELFEMRNKQLDPSILVLLNKIKTESTLLKDLSIQILNLFSIGGSSDKKEKVNLNNDISGVIENYKNIYQAKNITIEYAISNKKLSVYTNKFLFYIIVKNILENAIRYTDSGGSITIEVKEIGRKKVVSITDTGKGIYKKDLHKIWDTFYKTNESRNSEGFGLGLSLVAAAAKKAGLKIDVKSEYGKGTSFKVIL